MRDHSPALGSLVLAASAVALTACATGIVNGADAGTDRVEDTAVGDIVALDGADAFPCDPPCPQGMICMNGLCTDACATGQRLCGGICTDTTTDPSNCGACGTSCSDGGACNDGACATSCPNTETACAAPDGGTGTVCVNTSNDANNCGVCGQRCIAGSVCSGGLCQAACTGSQTLCGGSCVDTQTSATNCGSCGHACSSSEHCTSGQCCALSTYTMTTGSVSGNGTVCCNSGDVLTAVTDCGTGVNHGVSMNGNCGTGFEGAGNGGNACVLITCLHTVCM